MIGVALAKKAPASFCGLEKHAVTARIRRAIGDAMLHYVNINTGSKRLVEALAAGARDDFFDGEVGSLGVFAVKERSGNPNFIGHFDLGKDLASHRPSA